MTTSDFAAQEAAALAVVDEYIAAFNARDKARYAGSLHYPHMRVDGLGRASVWQSAEEYVQGLDFDAIADTGWSHSELNWKKVVQSGREKVHVAVSFTRYDENNIRLLTQESLYVVTHADDRWGISVRSSFLEQGNRRSVGS